ncbi:hypothetical protein EV700_2431 [Fluviicoccus keumensis]|uniref:Uncharacterized protein n=2 Tax=Fluviicoccus keumensis TaxID=1435465 RepID=A0A4Q7YLQ3_9GAMM|nr:hypothetical protein EV700_2431 [Fluviicoccus keumensis]
MVRVETGNGIPGHEALGPRRHSEGKFADQIGLGRPGAADDNKAPDPAKPTKNDLSDLKDVTAAADRLRVEPGLPVKEPVELPASILLERGVLQSVPWGVIANGHLSSVLAGVNEVEAAGLIPSCRTSAPVSSGADVLPAGASGVLSAAFSAHDSTAQGYPLRSVSSPVNTADPGDPVAGQPEGLAGLPLFWNKRRLQVVRQGQGVEILIRDYSLEERDLRTLAGDVRQALKEAGVMPNSIRVNGKIYWEALNPLPGVRHGG